MTQSFDLEDCLTDEAALLGWPLYSNVLANEQFVIATVTLLSRHLQYSFAAFVHRHAHYLALVCRPTGAALPLIRMPPPFELVNVNQSHLVGFVGARTFAALCYNHLHEEDGTYLQFFTIAATLDSVRVGLRVSIHAGRIQCTGFFATLDIFRLVATHERECVVYEYANNELKTTPLGEAHCTYAMVHDDVLHLLCGEDPSAQTLCAFVYGALVRVAAFSDFAGTPGFSAPLNPFVYAWSHKGRLLVAFYDECQIEETRAVLYHLATRRWTVLDARCSRRLTWASEQDLFDGELLIRENRSARLRTLSVFPKTLGGIALQAALRYMPAATRHKLAMRNTSVQGHADFIKALETLSL